MKQFNLEEYLANPSRKIITRDGRNARIICTDAKVVYGGDEFPIIALIQTEEKFECVPYAFQKDGKYLNCKNDDRDLFFAPEKHEGWVNVYKCKSGFSTLGIYSDKEHAEKWAGTNCVATIKIEWEE